MNKGFLVRYRFPDQYLSPSEKLFSQSTLDSVKFGGNIVARDSWLGGNIVARVRLGGNIVARVRLGGNIVARVRLGGNIVARVRLQI